MTIYTCSKCQLECEIIKIPVFDYDIQPDNESSCCGAEFNEIQETPEE